MHQCGCVCLRGSDIECFNFFVNALVVFIWKSRHTLYRVCWSDGGADHRHSLGVHRHAGEGERLDG